MWRPAASSRVWSRIDAPATALNAVAQPCQGSCPLQSTRENSLLRESYTNPRCHAKDPRILPCTVPEPTLHLNCRQPSQSVIHKGNRPEIARLLETLAAAGPGQPEQKPEPAQKSGRTLHTLGTEGVWWVEKDDLSSAATGQEPERSQEAQSTPCEMRHRDGQGSSLSLLEASPARSGRIRNHVQDTRFHHVRGLVSPDCGTVSSILSLVRFVFLESKRDIHPCPLTT